MRLAAATFLATLLLAAPAGAARDLVIGDVATGTQRLLASGEDTSWEGAPCWTRDGAVVAAGTPAPKGPRSYFELHPDGTRHVAGHAGPANTVVLAPGCTRVAEGRIGMPGRPRRNGLVVRDLASPEPLAQLFSYWPVEGPWMAWSNDGTRIADIDDSRRRDALRVIDVASSRTIARRPVRDDESAIMEGAFSPDGNHVLISQDRRNRRRGPDISEISVFDVRARTFRPLLRTRGGGPGTELGIPAWSPRGDLIAVDVGGRLHLLRRSGRDLGAIASPRPAYRPSWSPDGTQIAFLSLRRLPARRFSYPRIVYDLLVAPAVPGARPRRVLRDVHPELPAWSPDGASLAAVTF